MRGLILTLMIVSLISVTITGAGITYYLYLIYLQFIEEKIIRTVKGVEHLNKHVFYSLGTFLFKMCSVRVKSLTCTWTVC
jgi:hypothetical protein